MSSQERPQRWLQDWHPDWRSELRHRLQRGWGHVLDGLAPCHCALCGLPSHCAIELCPECESELPWLTGGCPQCALPLTGAAVLCGACLSQPPAFDLTVAAVEFAAPTAQLVHGFKYGGQLPLLPVLVELLALAIEDHLYDWGAPDLLVPMPMHWARRLRRGFNQAVLLADGLRRHRALREYSLCVDKTSCRRVRHTTPQRGLDAAARRSNLRRALVCRRQLEGRSIAIVDDVMTTGASVNALAQTLKAAGAARVEVWCCARTLSA